MKKAFDFLREQGAAQLASCVLCKLFYHSLRIIFPFDRWHASAPYFCRDYKRRIVDLAASRSPRVVADLGCGLGEVVARVPAASRYGFDPDGAVIAAGRLLFSDRVHFTCAALSDVELLRTSVSEPQVDLLIMTNWTHGLEIGELRRQLMALQAVLPLGAILVDTVRSGMMSNARCHTLADFEELGTVVESRDGGDGVRDLHLLLVPRLGKFP